MSGRNKLKKFSELMHMPNVLENYSASDPKLTLVENEYIDLKGKWALEYFKNIHEITLELACGRGEYTLALSESNPEKNFIGVDVKGARIWQGAQKALTRNLHNAAFLRTRIEQIEYFFGQQEIDEIWITFPDPFLKEGKSNRRLTSHPFINRYKNILKKKGVIHLKTDNDVLYNFTLESFSSHPDIEIIYHSNDIYADDLFIPELSFKTYYEVMHLGKGLKIKYIQAVIK